MKLRAVDIKNSQADGETLNLNGSAMAGRDGQPAVLSERFDDLDDLTDTVNGLGAWELDFVQLDRGSFQGELQQIALPTAVLGRLRLGRSIHQRGTPPHGFRTFGVLASGFPEFFMGEKPTSNSILIFPPGGEFDSVSDASFDAFPLSFQEQHLNRTCQRLGLPPVSELEPLRSHAVVPERAIADVRLRLRRVLRAVRDPGQLASRGLREAIEFDLPRSILMALDGCRPRKRPSVRLRDRAVRRALDFIRANEGSPMSVRDLCREVRVSWRTLDYAFRERFGVTPKAYLKAVRLNGVRRDLRSSRSAAVTVAEVAGRWGFWHMGQMAADYRKLFDELPSQTLRGS